MKSKLSPQDFKIRKAGNYQYFQFKGEDFTIDIEPNRGYLGVDSYDVARYDDRGILVGERIKIPSEKGDTPIGAFKRAVAAANGLYLMTKAETEHYALSR